MKITITNINLKTESSQYSKNFGNNKFNKQKDLETEYDKTNVGLPVPVWTE